MNAENLSERLINLEIKLSFQEDLIETLHRRHLELEKILELQQEQLRYLYQQLQQQTPKSAFIPQDNVPPHY